MGELQLFVRACFRSLNRSPRVYDCLESTLNILISCYRTMLTYLLIHARYEDVSIVCRFHIFHARS